MSPPHVPTQNVSCPALFNALCIAVPFAGVVFFQSVQFRINVKRTYDFLQFVKAAKSLTGAVYIYRFLQLCFRLLYVLIRWWMLVFFLAISFRAHACMRFCLSFVGFFGCVLPS